MNAVANGPRPVNSPTDHRLLPLSEVVSRSGMCRAKIYNLIRDGAFPPPAKLGRSSRWSSVEVDTFIAAVLAARPQVVPASPASVVSRGSPLSPALAGL